MLYFSFDCESVGIQGPTFAVGWTVFKDDGIEIDSGLINLMDKDVLERMEADREDKQWVKHYFLPLNIPVTHHSFRLLNNDFYTAYKNYQESGATVICDCPWPVEARFLHGIMVGERKWHGPYPLIDVASVLLAAGMDPLAEYERLENEREHDPLGDARQSGRIFLVAMNKIRQPKKMLEHWNSMHIGALPYGVGEIIKVMV